MEALGPRNIYVNTANESFHFYFIYLFIYREKYW